MITIKINNKRYGVKNLWSDLVIQDWINTAKLGITNEDHYFDYISKLIPIYSNIPSEVAERLDEGSKLVIWNWIEEFVEGLYDHKKLNYKPVGVQEFIFKDKKYYFPEYLNVANKVIPCYNLDSKSVIEVANLFQMFEMNKEQGVELLPLICATYIKEDRTESYNQKRIVERGELFKELPVTIALEVFFYLIFCLSSYMNHSLIFSTLGRKTIKKKLIELLNITTIRIGFMVHRMKKVWARFRKLKG